VSTKYIISLIFLTFHIPPNLAEVPPHKKAECNMTTYIISLYSNVHNIQYKAIVYFWFVWNYYCTGNSKAIVGASCPLKDFAGWRENTGAVCYQLVGTALRDHMPSASVERILAARKLSSYNCEYTLRKCKTLEKERLHLPMHQAKGKRTFFPSYNSECTFKPRVLGVNINAPAKKRR